MMREREEACARWMSKWKGRRRISRKSKADATLNPSLSPVGQSIRLQSVKSVCCCHERVSREQHILHATPSFARSLTQHTRMQQGFLTASNGRAFFPHAHFHSNQEQQERERERERARPMKAKVGQFLLQQQQPP